MTEMEEFIANPQTALVSAPVRRTRRQPHQTIALTIPEVDGFKGLLAMETDSL